jgi:hypothetical protein
MRDAVDFLGKTIIIEKTNYIIEKMYFIPNAVSKEHYLYFELQKEGGIFVNYSYYSLLPYLKEQIRL